MGEKQARKEILVSNTFSRNDAEFIRRAIESEYKERLSIVGKLMNGDADNVDVDLLIGIVSDDYARKGLDDSDEPNSYGDELESVIDKLQEYAAGIND